MCKAALRMMSRSPDHRTGNQADREPVRREPAVAVFTADWAAEDHAAEIVNLNAGLLFKLCDFDTLARLVRSYCDLPVKVA